MKKKFVFLLVLLKLIPYQWKHVFEQTGEEAGHLQIDHTSPSSGLFVPNVHVWDAVRKGEVLGEIRHPDGTVLAEMEAMRSGRILFLRTFPRVFSGDFLCYVIEMP